MKTEWFVLIFASSFALGAIVFFLTTNIYKLIKLNKEIKASQKQIGELRTTMLHFQHRQTKRHVPLSKTKVVDFDKFRQAFQGKTWTPDLLVIGAFSIPPNDFPEGYGVSSLNFLCADVWIIEGIGFLAKDLDTYHKINTYLVNVWNKCMAETNFWK